MSVVLRRILRHGDLVVIDFEGKVDGVAVWRSILDRG